MAARRNTTNFQSVARQSGGGFDYKFVEEVPEKYLCNICMKVLQEPQLTDCCGQNYCASCLQTWFAQQRKKQCPQCRQENFAHIIYWPLKREINELKIHCSNHKKGCKAVVKLGELGNHLSGNKTAACMYVSVACTNKCGIQILCKDLKKHLEECPKRKCRCQYCDYENTYEQITTMHYKRCTDIPVMCPNRCGAEPIKRKEVPAHKLTCPLEPVMCPLQEAGCKAKLVRSELASHMAENSQQHLVDMMGAFVALKRKFALLESHQQSLVTSMDSIRSSMDGIHSEIDYIDEQSQDSYNSENTNYAAIQCIKTHLMQPPKIKNIGDSVTFRMTNIKSTVSPWYSPPFYYGNGYKMCLEVKVRQNQISLLLMKGEFDDNLTWPGSSVNISLQVLNQSPYDAYSHFRGGFYHAGSSAYENRPIGFKLAHLQGGATRKVGTVTFNERQIANDYIVVQASLC